MKVGIIGAGRVGHAFSKALELSGASVELFENTTEDYDIKLKTIVNQSTVIMLTVPDSQIELLSNRIVKVIDSNNIKEKVFLHCSGALTSDVLKSIFEAGGYNGSLHPIQTFPDKINGWKSIFNIYFGFEGHEYALTEAVKIVKLLNGRLLEIKANDKALYHAAACILSNYTVTISNFAKDILEKIGIPSEQSMKAFGPLLENTVKNIIEIGTQAALTGPISRGDICTIENHMNALTQVKPEIKTIYSTLGEATVKLALAKGSIDDKKADLMLDLFR